MIDLTKEECYALGIATLGFMDQTGSLEKLAASTPQNDAASLAALFLRVADAVLLPRPDGITKENATLTAVTGALKLLEGLDVAPTQH